MTSPTPLTPHQDPSSVPTADQVTILEHVTTLVATLDRRFDTLHQDLKDHLVQRFADVDMRYQQQFIDSDLRYQQRFDAQKEALNAALAAAKEAVTTALTAAEKATSKAEVASDKRFESVNEFRQQLSDQTKTFVARSEYSATLASMAEKIDDLKADRDHMRGSASASPTVAAQLQALTDQVTSLRDSRATDAGRSGGLASGWAYLVAGVGLVATVITVIIALAFR